MTDFANLQEDALSAAGLVNENGLIPTRYGGNKKSWQYLVDQFEAEFAQTLLDINKSRGYRVVGTFAAGFEYELFNDVGIDASGNSWIYVGTGAPAATVTVGTDPSLSADYQQVTFNSIDGVSGLRDELNERALYLTLAEAQARTDLVLGQYVRLVDHASALYQTVPNSDIGGAYKTGLQNNLKLKLVVDSHVRTSWYGVNSNADLALLRSLSNVVYIDGDINPIDTLNIGTDGGTYYLTSTLNGSALPSDSNGIILIVSGDENKLFGGELINSNFYSVLTSGNRNKLYFMTSRDSTFSAFVDSGIDNKFFELDSHGAGWDAAQNSGRNAQWHNCNSYLSKRHGFSTDVDSVNTEFHSCLAVDTGNLSTPEGQDGFHFEGTDEQARTFNCRSIYTSAHPMIQTGYPDPTRLQYLKGFLSVDANSNNDNLQIQFSDDFITACNTHISRPPVSVECRTDNKSESKNTFSVLSTKGANLFVYSGAGVVVDLDTPKLNSIEFVKLFLADSRLNINGGNITGALSDTLFRWGDSLTDATTTNYAIRNVRVSGGCVIKSYGRVFNGVAIDCSVMDSTIESVAYFARNTVDTSNTALTFDGFVIASNNINGVSITFLEESNNQPKGGIQVKDNIFDGTINTLVTHSFGGSTWEGNRKTAGATITTLESGSTVLGLNSELYSYVDAGCQAPTTASPVGSRTPDFLGQEVLQTNTSPQKWWKSIGLTNSDWVELN